MYKQLDCFYGKTMSDILDVCVDPTRHEKQMPSLSLGLSYDHNGVVCARERTLIQIYLAFYAP